MAAANTFYYVLISQGFTGCTYPLSVHFFFVFPFLQVNLAIMQKQLSEMAIGHPRQSSSNSRQNGFSGGVGALGIMNNRLAETSVDR